MFTDSHSIERRSLSFFFKDIALWPRRIWIFPQLVDVSLDLPGIGFIKALHISLSLKRYRCFKCHKTASLPIFSILLLLDRFANQLISIECSLRLASGVQPFPAACYLSAAPRKSGRLPGARPAVGACPARQRPPGCADWGKAASQPRPGARLCRDFRNPYGFRLFRLAILPHGSIPVRFLPTRIHWPNRCDFHRLIALPAVRSPNRLLQLCWNQ